MNWIAQDVARSSAEFELKKYNIRNFHIWRPQWVGGWGSSKSRWKKQNKLICDSDKGAGGQKIRKFANVFSWSSIFLFVFSCFYFDWTWRKSGGERAPRGSLRGGEEVAAGRWPAIAPSLAFSPAAARQRRRWRRGRRWLSTCSGATARRWWREKELFKHMRKSRIGDLRGARRVQYRDLGHPLRAHWIAKPI